MTGTPTGVHLVRGRDRTADVEVLVGLAGGRVGLSGVLAGLGGTGRTGRTRRLRCGPGLAWSWSWAAEDRRSARWWPQGLTTSADHHPSEEYDGRAVVLTSSYSKKVGGVGHGARIGVLDVSDPGRVRYEHVLLVRVGTAPDGGPAVHPVRAHAGGLVWCGDLLHVAATATGVHTFHLGDVLATDPLAEALGPLPGGGVAALGHRYLLPLRHTHAGRADPGVPEHRFSFLSLDRDEGRPRLLAGEYGRAGMTTRLSSWDLDGDGDLQADPDGVARPTWVADAGLPRMQGAVRVGGRLHVVTSNGRWGRGSLWVGAPGGWREHRWALPAGPEDVAYWPSRDQLWTSTEHQRRRKLLALRRDRFS